MRNSWRSGESFLVDWLDPQLRLNDMRVEWLGQGLSRVRPQWWGSGGGVVRKLRQPRDPGCGVVVVGFGAAGC